MGDVNGDGVYEIIHGDRSDDKIYIFDMNGNKISEPFDVGYEQEDRIAAGEVNNDGKDEIILADDSKDWINIFDIMEINFKSMHFPTAIIYQMMTLIT